MHSRLSSVVQELKRLFSDSLRHPVRTSLAENGPFEILALRLFRLQFALNPPYRTLCHARGVTPGSVDRWRQIPAVPTSAFKELAFSCLPEAERTAYFESSGTTGSIRSRSHHSQESLELYHASLLPWFQHHLLPETADAPEDNGSARWNLISLTPPLLQAPHSSLVHMLNTVARQRWFNHVSFVGACDDQGSWTLDSDAFLASIDRSRADRRPVILAGTAFNYVHLLDALGTGSLRLPDGSRIMETGGYKGRSRELSRDELHRELCLRLDVVPEDIVTEYGMAELGSQAYDRVVGQRLHGCLLKFPPWTRVSVVSAETGREVPEGGIGLVRVVDLANVFSVVAVETGDLAIRHAQGIQLIGRSTQAEARGCSMMAV